MQTLAQNVRGIQVPNSGQRVPEEQPQFVRNSSPISLVVVILLKPVNENYAIILRYRRRLGAVPGAYVDFKVCTIPTAQNRPLELSWSGVNLL